ncbi:hypothetical protein LMG28727_06524 [Paraburkholderia kirstenboschensis]|nr:hypothetical protein LMG28727_06524 [Paraburkholderia kirstenboschensis]
MLGSFGRDPLDVGDELLIALPDSRQRSLGAPLRTPCLLRLKHDALLDALESRRRLVDLCPQRRVMFGVGGAQRVEFMEMRRSHVVQRLFRLRADGVPLGRSCFGQPECGVTPAQRLREFRQHGGKSCLVVIKLTANGAKFALNLCVGRLKGSGTCDGCGGFRFKFVTTLRKDTFALFDRERPHREHGTGHRRRQRGAQRVNTRLLVLPQLQFVVDRRTAALADLGIDQIDGELMREATCGDEPRGSFTGAKTGVADAAQNDFGGQMASRRWTDA